VSKRAEAGSYQRMSGPEQRQIDWGMSETFRGFAESGG
jgi:hypothetical protein